MSWPFTPQKLIGLQAKTARMIRDRVEVDIPFEEVLIGDTVVVRQGEKVPVDGVVLTAILLLMRA